MNIKQQADSYVEMFKPFVNGTDWTEKFNATRCAIIHVEGLIRIVESFVPYEERKHYDLILTELKSRI